MQCNNKHKYCHKDYKETFNYCQNEYIMVLIKIMLIDVSLKKILSQSIGFNKFVTKIL